MIQILLLLFSLILVVIGWYFKKHVTDLEVLFSNHNKQTISHFAYTLCFSGILGIILGIFIPSKVVALFFISFVLIVSAIFSIRLSQKMR
ncbi:hypothetical protein ACQUEF_07060 [Vagococcus fluvialis]|uniref:hypothetical protein n=1 Tax=Vagococcus fluvialis TaxID=2738 RepID=UPI001A90930F|nr:hypothetical protein [Vagococcus fluvialis]MBO0487584.1 hypothetical protein [Vagococcus fluvialis]MDR2278620.1 hypothetical protein [Vagococcus sp.]